MFTCFREDLAKALSKVANVVERSSIKSIYEHVLIAVKENKLLLTTRDSSNNEITAETSLKSPVRKAEEVCVQAMVLQSILDSVPFKTKEIAFKTGSGRMQITTTGGESKASNSLFTLATRPANEFPRESSSHKEVARIELEQAELLSTINRLLPAIATELHRQYLTGMYFNFTGKELRLVATDGHRMAVKEFAGIETEEMGIIVPRRTIILLQKLLDAESKANVEITALKDAERVAAMKFVLPGVELIASPIDATYPDYMKVIPEENEHTAIFECPELQSACRQASTVLDRRGDSINVQIAPNAGKISAHGAQSQNEAELSDIAVEYDGEPMAFMFNCNYLTDMITAFIEHGKVKFMSSPGRESILFESTDESDNLKYVVMPVRR